MYFITSFNEKDDGCMPQTEYKDGFLIVEKDIRSGTYDKTPTLFLSRRAKMTDFITNTRLRSNYGLIVSERAKNIFLNKVPEIISRRMKLVDQKSCEIDCYYIFTPRSDKHINFSKTLFVKLSSRSFESYLENIFSNEKLQLIKKELDKSSVYINKLELNDDAPELVFLETNVVYEFRDFWYNFSNVIISDHLKEELENAGCKGMTFVKVPTDPVMPE